MATARSFLQVSVASFAFATFSLATSPGIAQDAPRGQLHVDLNDALGPVTQRSSGFLWSVSATEPADEALVPVKPRLYRSRLTPWRVGTGIPGMMRMATLGARVQVVLSDEYALRFPPRAPGADKNDGFGYHNVTHWPGDAGDFALWDRVVEHAVRAVADAGLTVQWDVWEEPNWEGWWEPSREQFFTTWTRTHRLIKSLDPEAELVGPSINRYDPGYLRAFLLHAKSTQTVPEVLSWHEIIEEHSPANIPGHVEDIRAFMRANSIEIEHIDINEMVSANRQTTPGIHVWYFAAIERAGVSGACKATWLDEDPNIYNAWWATLGGLLTHPNHEPRSTWWVYKSYADLVGQMVSVKGDRTMDGVAAIDERTVRVLIGRTGWGAPGYSVGLHGISAAQGLARDGEVRVVAHRIPDTGWDPLAEPLLLFDSIVPVEADAVKLDFSVVPPREAMTIRLETPPS
jgi:hypothetical protein